MTRLSPEACLIVLRHIWPDADTSQLDILVKISENSKNVKVLVSDNGLGVSKSNREKIFDPKFTTKSDGMGLGLGIVRNIISSHRGKISYKSKNKKGTDFTITLPK